MRMYDLIMKKRNGKALSKEIIWYQVTQRGKFPITKCQP